MKKKKKSEKREVLGRGGQVLGPRQGDGGARARRHAARGGRGRPTGLVLDRARSRL